MSEYSTDLHHFLAIKELNIHGDLYRHRTDIDGFVNGIPLLFVELKVKTVDLLGRGKPEHCTLELIGFLKGKYVLLSLVKRLRRFLSLDAWPKLPFIPSQYFI